MGEVKLNFLMIGKTGQGKSALGNTIVNRATVFKTSANTMSQTKDVDYSFAHFENYILLVVDGPGLEDTDMSKVKVIDTAVKNMNKAIGMCYGGIDAFLFVVKFGNRFTAEDRSTLNSLKRIFGNNFMDHVVVVVTSGDAFQSNVEAGECGPDFKEWCKQQTGGFRQLCDDCKGRVVLFNNKDKNEANKRAQMQQLVNTAHALQKQYNRYDAECFKCGEREREKLILELNAPQLKIEVQEKIGVLVADIEMYAQHHSENDKEKLKLRVKNLKKEIDRHDKGHNVLAELRELAKKVEANLHDAEKLQILAKELENLGKSKKTWGLIGTVCSVAAGGALAVVALPVGAVAGGVGLLATGIHHMTVRSDEKINKNQQAQLQTKVQQFKGN